MLTIEFEPPVQGEPCECCGGRTTSLTRFVYWDGDAHAVYYASLSDTHPLGYVSVLISIGEWGEDAPPSARDSFYVRIRLNAENFEVNVRSGHESPWDAADIMGRTLERDEALAHPRLKEVFHITDHIVTEDTPVIEYLSKEEKRTVH
jgi:hypothetical protein